MFEFLTTRLLIDSVTVFVWGYRYSCLITILKRNKTLNKTKTRKKWTILKSDPFSRDLPEQKINKTTSTSKKNNIKKVNERNKKEGKRKKRKRRWKKNKRKNEKWDWHRQYEPTPQGEQYSMIYQRRVFREGIAEPCACPARFIRINIPCLTFFSRNTDSTHRDGWSHITPSTGKMVEDVLIMVATIRQGQLVPPAITKHTSTTPTSTFIKKIMLIFSYSFSL